MAATKNLSVLLNRFTLYSGSVDVDPVKSNTLLRANVD